MSNALGIPHLSKFAIPANTDSPYKSIKVADLDKYSGGVLLVSKASSSSKSGSFGFLRIGFHNNEQSVCEYISYGDTHGGNNFYIHNYVLYYSSIQLDNGYGLSISNLSGNIDVVITQIDTIPTGAAQIPIKTFSVV